MAGRECKLGLSWTLSRWACTLRRACTLSRRPWTLSRRPWVFAACPARPCPTNIAWLQASKSAELDSTPHLNQLELRPGDPTSSSTRVISHLDDDGGRWGWTGSWRPSYSPRRPRTTLPTSPRPVRAPKGNDRFFLPRPRRPRRAPVRALQLERPDPDPAPAADAEGRSRRPSSAPLCPNHALEQSHSQAALSAGSR